MAQAVAGFAFVFAVYGWGVVGPTEIARLGADRRGAYFFDSLLSRVWLSIVVIPVSIVTAILIIGHDALLAALTVTSGILVALGSGWFFVGESSPIRFLLIDTVPRVAGTVVGALVLIATGDVIAFAELQLAGVLDLDGDRRLEHPRPIPRLAIHALAGARPSEPVRAGEPGRDVGDASVYVNVPIVLIDLFLPSATAVLRTRRANRTTGALLDATDRPDRPGLGPGTRSIRTGRSRTPSHRDRPGSRGCWGASSMPCAGPWIGDLLSGGTLSISVALAVPMGVNLAAILASQLTGFACLTAFGLTKPLATSTIAGAIVGTLLMYPLLLWIGAPGVAWGLAIAELCVLAVQLVALAPRLRRQEPLGS